MVLKNDSLITKFRLNRSLLYESFTVLSFLYNTFLLLLLEILMILKFKKYINEIGGLGTCLFNRHDVKI